MKWWEIRISSTQSYTLGTFKLLCGWLNSHFLSCHAAAATNLKVKKSFSSPFFRSWVQLHRKDLDEIFECTVGSGDCWSLDLRW